MHKKTTKNVYLGALLLFIVGITYLVFTGFSENSIYFLNVTEALAMPTEKLKAIRLFGIVTEESISSSEDGRTISFQIKDKDTPLKTLWVEYTGIIPDTFTPGAEVIVEGTLTPKGTFQAKTLMTKCPSRYQKENREDTL